MSPRCRVCGNEENHHDDDTRACPNAFIGQRPVIWSHADTFSPLTVPPPSEHAATHAVYNETRGEYYRAPDGATYAMPEERARECADAWSRWPGGAVWTAMPIRLDERDAEVRRLRSDIGLAVEAIREVMAPIHSRRTFASDVLDALLKVYGDDDLSEHSAHRRLAELRARAPLERKG